jgi:hypothetical protein
LSVSRLNHSKLQEHAYVSGEQKLILLVLRCLDVDTGPHDHPAHKLLANEVPDLNLKLVGLLVLLDVDVDGEMGVDVAHLVLVALGDTDDQVVDEGADGAEGSDALARAVVELDLDEVLLGVGERDSQVAEGLLELATGACRRQYAIFVLFPMVCVCAPSTTTFLVLMVTLTPSGISSNSSEWLRTVSPVCASHVRVRWSRQTSNRIEVGVRECETARRSDSVLTQRSGSVTTYMYFILEVCCGLAIRRRLREVRSWAQNSWVAPSC